MVDQNNNVPAGDSKPQLGLTPLPSPEAARAALDQVRAMRAHVATAISLFTSDGWWSALERALGKANINDSDQCMDALLTVAAELRKIDDDAMQAVLATGGKLTNGAAA